jgi:hypothetical protein
MKILLLIIAMLLTSSAYADPDWNRGRGWNKNALKYYTNECVSTKMVDVQTEFAAKMGQEIQEKVSRGKGKGKRNHNHIPGS